MGLLLDTQATRSTLMSVDSTLSETITASQDYIPIASITNFSTSVVAEIETTNEVVSFGSITTNLFTYSEQFDNATWNKWNGSISANAAAAPDGTTTADNSIPTTTNSLFHGFYKIYSGSENTVSVYAKSNGYDHLNFVFRVGNTDSQGVQFKLSDGTITASQNATGTITSAGDGWYRCAVTPTTTSTSTQIWFNVSNDSVPDESNKFSPAAWTPDGSSGILLWGAQLEDTAAVTGYLPTVASSLSGLTTVTRGVNGTTAASATSGDSIQQLPYALSEVNMPTRLKGLSVTSDGTGAGRLTLCDKVGTTLCDVDIPDNRLYDLSWDGGIIFPNGIYVANSDNITAYTLYTDKHSGAGVS